MVSPLAISNFFDIWVQFIRGWIQLSWHIIGIIHIRQDSVKDTLWFSKAQYYLKLYLRSIKKKKKNKKKIVVKINFHLIFLIFPLNQDKYKSNWSLLDYINYLDDSIWLTWGCFFHPFSTHLNSFSFFFFFTFWTKII